MNEKSNLFNKKDSIGFYEERYRLGYMDQWPDEKKERVYEILKTLNLPKNGMALDFGCGTGEFTQVIKRALPSWDVYGCEITEVAVQKARKKYTSCQFFTASEDYKNKFNLIFSHHVLEHVYNLEEVLAEVKSYAQKDEESFILHVLPCGNKGSFEYSLCTLLKDGINTSFDNRFFFEEEGHLRRLDTIQMNELHQRLGYQMVAEFYSNQYYGALQWISDNNREYILKMTDSSNAINEDAIRKLNRIRKKLLRLRQLKLFVRNHENNRHVSYQNLVSSLTQWIKRIIALPLARIIVNHYRRKALGEWNFRKTDRNGSEMFMFYKNVISSENL